MFSDSLMVWKSVVEISIYFRHDQSNLFLANKKKWLEG